MANDTPAALGALQVDEGKLKGHVDEVVRSSVEDTLNALLEEEADRILDTLLSMDWHFVQCRSASLLTSDNPIFMFDEGLRGAKSEMTIPISRSIALWLTMTAAGSQVATATRDQEKELNRRTARGAARFLYSATNEPWILPLHCKVQFSPHRWELLGGQ